MEGKNAEGKIEDTYGKYDAGEGTALTELWEMVAGLAVATVPKGGAHFAEVTGKLNLGIAVIESKFEFEIADKSPKVGVKGRVDFGTTFHPLPGFDVFGVKLRARSPAPTRSRRPATRRPSASA